MHVHSNPRSGGTAETLGDAARNRSGCSRQSRDRFDLLDTWYIYELAVITTHFNMMSKTQIEIYSSHSSSARARTSSCAVTNATIQSPVVLHSDWYSGNYPGRTGLQHRFEWHRKEATLCLSAIKVTLCLGIF
jgi:hypothetical protein